MYRTDLPLRAQVTPSLVILAIRVRDSGRFVLRHLAPRSFCTLTVSPRALGGNFDWSQKPTVSRHQLDDSGQICLAAQTSEIDVTPELVDRAKTTEVGATCAG